jgi:hypothetical protein
LQHTELLWAETKKQLARVQEQYKSAEEDDREYQQEQMEQQQLEFLETLEKLKQEHAQALQATRQEYEQALEAEAQQRQQIRQILDGQELLLQEERTKNRQLQSLERQLADSIKHCQSLQEHNMLLQRSADTQKQVIEKQYEVAWSKMKRQRQQTEQDHREESKRSSRCIVRQQVQIHLLHRMVSQLVTSVEGTTTTNKDIDDVEEDASVRGKNVRKGRAFLNALQTKIHRDDTLSLPEVTTPSSNRDPSVNCDGSDSTTSNTTKQGTTKALRANPAMNGGGVTGMISTIIKQSWWFFVAAAGSTLTPAWVSSLFLPSTNKKKASGTKKVKKVRPSSATPQHQDSNEQPAAVNQ